MALSYLHRYEEALTALEEALRINPKDPEAWDNKGVAVGSLRGDQEALRCFEEAFKLSPGYQRAWFH